MTYDAHLPTDDHCRTDGGPTAASDATRVLLLLAEVPPQPLAVWAGRYAETPLTVLCLDDREWPDPLPSAWRLCPRADLGDLQRTNQEILAFVDVWPRTPLTAGQSFDDLFRRPDGYSVWWTGPGVDRFIETGPLPALRALWLCDAAIKKLAPQRIGIFTTQPELAWALAARLRQTRCEWEFLPGSAKPGGNPFRGAAAWLAGALLRAMVFPVAGVLRMWLARRATPLRPLPAAEAQVPAILVASTLNNNYNLENGQLTASAWNELAQSLAQRNPRLRMCHLVTAWGNFWGYRLVCQVYHTIWPWLRTLPEALPVSQTRSAWRCWLQALPGHLRGLWRYYRLEHSAGFRRSFQFAGADVAPLYVPELRIAIARLAEWAQSVGAVVQSIQAAGNVKAMLVDNEMYAFGMIHIAAARRLGIPTVGIQHGTIMPGHLIYTIPPGQMAGAPVPDFFAAYSQYAKDVLSLHGAYPAERIWVTGGARFDHLATHPLDRREARARLGLAQENRVVLLTTQVYGWFPTAARSLFAICKDVSDITVCVKTHYLDVPLAVYRQIAAVTGAENVLFFTDRLEYLLAAADVVVSGSSTTLLQALLLGRRAISLNFSSEPELYPYVADGGALGATNHDALRHALERVFDPATPERLEGVRQFLARHAGPAAEGRAAESLAEKILGLCSGGTPGDNYTALTPCTD